MFLFLTLRLVCVPPGRCGNWGGEGETTEQPYDQHRAPFQQHLLPWGLEESFLHWNSFIMGNAKFSFHFYDRTWNFMSDRLLQSLGLGPHIVVMFLYFRVMLVAKFAKQTLACHVPLAWSLNSFLYVLFLRYKVFNKDKRWLNEHNSIVNILK